MDKEHYNDTKIKLHELYKQIDVECNRIKMMIEEYSIFENVFLRYMLDDLTNKESRIDVLIGKTYTYEKSIHFYNAINLCAYKLTHPDTS